MSAIVAMMQSVNIINIVFIVGSCFGVGEPWLLYLGQERVRGVERGREREKRMQFEWQVFIWN